jgi:hypothetical protein
MEIASDIPTLERLTHIFSQAVAPTFFLGAVAGFISLMSTRMSAVIDRIRELNAIAEDDPQRLHLKSDVARLKRRASLLQSGIYSALLSGICATLLLAILFGSEFAGLNHAYGAGALFFIATFCLGFALLRFAQEARIGLGEADHYR